MDSKGGCKRSLARSLTPEAFFRRGGYLESAKTKRGERRRGRERESERGGANDSKRKRKKGDGRRNRQAYKLVQL